MQDEFIFFFIQDPQPSHDYYEPVVRSLRLTVVRRVDLSTCRLFFLTLLLVRILQGRAWKAADTYTSGSSNMVLTASSRFSRATVAPVNLSKGETFVEDDLETGKRRAPSVTHSDASIHRPAEKLTL